MSTNIQHKLKTIAVAEDVSNLLEHIAWTETIRPKLLAHKAAFEKLLVEAVLGQKPVMQNGQVITAEQLAGKVYGIDYILNLLQTILQQGVTASTDIQSAGFSLNNNNN